MKIINFLGLIMFLISVQPLFSQLATDVYWIQFTDKNNTNYNLDQPEDYLSVRSIQRRERYEIAIDSTDLPVNSWYLDSLTQKGAQIIHVSKWLNGCAVHVQNTNVLDSIYQLSFVDYQVSISDAFTMHIVPVNVSSNIAAAEVNSYDYGSSVQQINIHHGAVLHNNGYRGEGMLIAMIDAGYAGLDSITAFDSLFINHQILHTWDFVDQNENVYDDHYHGKACLSTIAANLPGEMIGSAPKADFLLYRTENAYSELKIEEINWVLAAEMSDSIGADLISSSLGYNNFDNPSNSYTWIDLDGQTAPITRAADMAANKGILVLISAGNDGNNNWIKIACPADANNVLTVGACSVLGEIANFSSRGNTTDGRIKPDIISVGKSTNVITGSQPTYGNGTSYSTPLVAGLSACLWQADKSRSNFEIMDLIRRHSHRYNTPDSLMGYGIPNFKTALAEINQANQVIKSKKEQIIRLYPSPFSNQVHLNFFSLFKQKVLVSLESLHGITYALEEFSLDSNKVNYITLNHLEYLPNGVYIFSVRTNRQRYLKKIVKVN